MKKYDVLIIGSGPAGMNAALYASRMNLKTAIIEKGAPGGKLVNISKIENWIGDELISGPQLALRMNAHVNKNGAESIFGTVAKINENDNTVTLQDETLVEYKYLIIATGTSETVPHDVEGIHNYYNRGISYCAICDGPLFKDEVVAVMGGGNSAIEEATYLASVAKEVHIFVRSTIKAEPKLVEDMNRKNNIVVHLGEEVKKLSGEERLQKVTTTKGEYEIKAMFPYIGLTPNTSFIEGTSINSDNGFIIVDDHMKTSVDNIYSIGDVNKKAVRQISTAVSDGTIAAKTIANLI